MLQRTATEDTHSILLILGNTRGINNKTVFIKTQSDTLLFFLGQRLTPFLVAPLEGGLQTLTLRSHHKRATTHIFCLDIDALLTIAHHTFHIDSLAKLVANLECHTVFHTTDQMTTLRIELHHKVVFLLPGKTGLGTLVHGTHIIVASLLWLAIDGQHTRIEAIPYTEIVCSHIFIVEPPSILGAVLMMTNIKVQHPTGVGPHLVIAGIKRVCQYKLSAGIAFGIDYDLLTLYQQTVRRQQLNIENTAQVCGLQIVGPNNISLIPQGVAHKITLVIGMEIYLFLHLRQRRLQQGLTNVLNISGLDPKGQKQKHRKDSA